MKFSPRHFFFLFLFFSFCSSPVQNTETIEEPVDEPTDELEQEETAFQELSFEVKVESGYAWEYGYTFTPQESRPLDDELPPNLLDDFEILIGIDGKFDIWEIDTSGLSDFLGTEESAPSQWAVITILNEPLSEDEIEWGDSPYIWSKSADTFFLIEDIQWSEATEVNAEAEEEEAIVVEEEVENFISIVSPEDGLSFYEEPVVFSGEVSPNVEKIIVTAYYPDSMDRSKTLKDVYTLQDFQPGDTSFTYRAKVAWDNLGYGLNSYTFVAYFTDGSEQTATVNIWFEVLLPSDQ